MLTQCCTDGGLRLPAWHPLPMARGAASCSLRPQGPLWLQPLLLRVPPSLLQEMGSLGAAQARLFPPGTPSSSRIPRLGTSRQRRCGAGGSRGLRPASNPRRHCQSEETEARGRQGLCWALREEGAGPASTQATAPWGGRGSSWASPSGGEGRHPGPPPSSASHPRGHLTQHTHSHRCALSRAHTRNHTHAHTPLPPPLPTAQPQSRKVPPHPAHRCKQTGTGLAKQWRFIGAGSARGCAEAAGSAHSWEAGRCEAPQGPRRPRDSTTCKTRGPFSSQLRRWRLHAARTEEEASAPGRQGCQGGGLASLLAGAGPVMES